MTPYIPSEMCQRRSPCARDRFGVHASCSVHHRPECKPGSVRKRNQSRVCAGADLRHKLVCWLHLLSTRHPSLCQNKIRVLQHHCCQVWHNVDTLNVGERFRGLWPEGPHSQQQLVQNRCWYGPLFFDRQLYSLQAFIRGWACEYMVAVDISDALHA